MNVIDNEKWMTDKDKDNLNNKYFRYISYKNYTHMYNITPI